MSNLKNINQLNKHANLLKMLGHPTRLCIIESLIQKKQCNVTSMYQCLNVPQSTVSQHISKLKAAGIIRGTRHGLEIKYEIVDERVIQIINALNSNIKNN